MLIKNIDALKAIYDQSPSRTRIFISVGVRYVKQDCGNSVSPPTRTPWVMRREEAWASAKLILIAYLHAKRTCSRASAAVGPSRTLTPEITTPRDLIGWALEPMFIRWPVDNA
jgi:hypothetical protein